MISLSVVVLLMASGPEPTQATPLDHEPHGVFVGESWRYQHHSVLGGLALRTLADLVSIPTGIGGWSWLDVTLFTGITAASVGLAWPFSPSLDARIQGRLHSSLGPDHFRLWTKTGDLIIWVAVAGAFASLAAYGALSEGSKSPYLETAMLALEALLVTQVYVTVAKALTGREGPTDEQGQGLFHGPQGFVKYYPSGIPSGHAASMWSLFSVVMTYWQSPLLTVLLGALGSVLTVTLVTDDYHFVSEALLGAALGIAVGRWVVRHRGSRFTYGGGGVIERLNLAPAIVPGSSYGISMSFAF